MLKKRYENILFEDNDLRKKDYLGNLIYAESLEQKISEYFDSDKNKPLYIALTGSWGSGKSTIANTAVEIIKEKYQVKVFNYDAWKYEGDSFRRTFTRNILDNSGIKKESSKYKDFLNRMYDDKSVETNSINEGLKLSKHINTEYNNKILIIIFVIAFVLISCISYFFHKEMLTVIAISLSIINSIGLVSFILTYIIKLSDKFLNAKVTYVFQKLFSPEQFYEIVNEILKEVKEPNKIILIDNIDRCNTEEFKETISSIKGFFNDNGKIVYIIPFDIDQFSLAYDKEYQSYSEKVFDFSIDIKEKSQKNIIEFVDKLLIDEKNVADLFTNEAMDIIAKSDCKTPRQIINICNNYITEYNLFVIKNNIKTSDITQDDLSYLMKYTILKKYHQDLFRKIHNNIDIIKKLDSFALNRMSFEDAQKNYSWLNESSFSFLRKTSSITPLNYAYFYSSQSTDDFEINPEILEAIQTEEYEQISNIISDNIKKNNILNYMKNSIMYDKNRDLWKQNIGQKMRLIIFLLKNKKLTPEEVDTYLNFIVKDINLFNKLIYSREIDINDSIDFINIMSKDDSKKYNLDIKLLAGVINNNIKYEDNEKDEIISTIFGKLEIKKLNEKESNYFTSHIDNLINNHTYKNIPHLNILKSDIRNYISLDQIKKMLDNINSNDVESFLYIIDLIKNLQSDKLDDELINKFISFVNRVYTKANCIDFFANIFGLFYDDIEHWEPFINKLNIAISDEYFDNNICDLLYNLFKNCGNQNIKNLILSTNLKDNKKYIYNKIVNEKELNENLISLSKEFIIKMDANEFEEKLHNNASIYKKSNLEFKEWFNQHINLNFPDKLTQFYDELSSHEDKENLCEYITSLSIPFDEKLYRIKFFMSSNERFISFVNELNSLDQLEKVLFETNVHYKNITVERIAYVIDGKTSIINDDLEIIIRILGNDTISLQNKKQILNAIGLQKTNSLDLKRIYDVIPDSPTIKQQYNNIKSFLYENGIIDNKKHDLEKII